MKDRHDYMTSRAKDLMGNHHRTHANCMAFTGVRRPGKTAKDRANTITRRCLSSLPANGG